MQLGQREWILAMLHLTADPAVAVPLACGGMLAFAVAVVERQGGTAEGTMKDRVKVELVRACLLCPLMAACLQKASAPLDDPITCWCFLLQR
jgi:hypothetical protein